MMVRVDRSAALSAMPGVVLAAYGCSVRLAFTCCLEVWAGCCQGGGIGLARPYCLVVWADWAHSNDTGARSTCCRVLWADCPLLVVRPWCGIDLTRRVPELIRLRPSAKVEKRELGHGCIGESGGRGA